MASFSIATTCQTGSYRVEASVKENGATSDLATGTKEFTVVAGPSVTIEFASTSLNRGTTGGVTLKFHDLASGESYSYRAYAMQRSPRNYADSCSGSGLGTSSANIALGTVDENPETRSGQIATTCPTGDYTLYLKLYDSSSVEKASTTADFSVVTDPGATPSTQIEFSANSDDADTAIDVTIKLFRSAK